MLLSPGKNGLDSLFKEVRVFKVSANFAYEWVQTAFACALYFLSHYSGGMDLKRAVLSLSP